MSGFVNVAQEELSSGKIQGNNSLSPPPFRSLSFLPSVAHFVVCQTLVRKYQTYTTVPAFPERLVYWGKQLLIKGSLHGECKITH